MVDDLCRGLAGVGLNTRLYLKLQVQNELLKKIDIILLTNCVHVYKERNSEKTVFI